MNGAEHSRTKLLDGGAADGDISFGASERMRQIDAMISHVAVTDIGVLISGESGVGKELVARAIHQRSPRRQRPFVRVNCAALPLELLESELFGYERGAFTGADRPKPGKFELAHTGTMFLDEIGEIPLPLQAKLLHVLQDHQFSRLGSRRDIRVDVRIVAATNQTLGALVAAGTFRNDLYFRLNVVNIRVPALRERPEEIPGLVRHFLERYCARYGRPWRELKPATLTRFLEYPWPGNVRELENMVKRIVALDDETWVLEELRPDASGPAAPAVPVIDPGTTENGAGSMIALSPTALEQALLDAGLKGIARRAAHDAERLVLEHVLQRARWNRVEAARLLKINYKTLLLKIREHGLGARRPRHPA